MNLSGYESKAKTKVAFESNCIQVIKGSSNVAVQHLINAVWHEAPMKKSNRLWQAGLILLVVWAAFYSEPSVSAQEIRKQDKGSRSL